MKPDRKQAGDTRGAALLLRPPSAAGEGAVERLQDQRIYRPDRREAVRGKSDESPARFPWCLTIHASALPGRLRFGMPRDHLEFAAFLFEAGLNSISLNPDSVIGTIDGVAETENSKSKSGIETLLVGGLAAALAYGMGHGVRSLYDMF